MTQTRWQIAQLNPTLGAIGENLDRIHRAIQDAVAQKTDWLVFPELAISGYPPKDWLTQPPFVDTCLAANTQLVRWSQQYEIGLIWGNLDRSPAGKPLYNAGWVAHSGQHLATARKAHLPTYDVFDEARYFEPAPVNQAIATWEWQGETFGLCICEDLWSHPALDAQELGTLAPVRYATALFPQTLPQWNTLVNLSASPFERHKPQQRIDLLQRLANQTQTQIVYANQVGGQDDLIFDGHSGLYTPHQPAQIWPGYNENLSPSSSPPLNDEAALHAAIILGLRDYFRKTGFQRAFLGLSGGIDSAVTACLVVEALGAENVIGVSMPGPYSSNGSQTDAQQLADALEIPLWSHPITAVDNLLRQQLFGAGLSYDLAEQNLQARLRGVVLMSLANRHGGLVVTTSNKSELAMGYSTLYGDSCGAIAPIGDLLKTQVYALAQWLNTQQFRIPQASLEKPPSAELAPNQQDSDSLPPYDQLDAILAAHLEAGQSFAEIQSALGYNEATLRRVQRGLLTSEFKRQQAPLVLKLSPKAFGSGWDYPIAHGYRQIMMENVP